MMQLLESATATAQMLANDARERINAAFGNMEPWQIAAISVAITIVAVHIWRFLFARDRTSTAASCDRTIPAVDGADASRRAALWTRTKRAFFATVRRLPWVRDVIRRKMDEAVADIQHSMLVPSPVERRTELPTQGHSATRVLDELKRLSEMGDVDWRQGRASGVVYHGGEELTDLIAKAYRMFSWTNPLHPQVFPGVRQMEAEVVAMCLRLFHGDDDDACGVMTSGGTESILMACKAYRDRGRSAGIEHPEMYVGASRPVRRYARRHASA